MDRNLSRPVIALILRKKHGTADPDTVEAIMDALELAEELAGEYRVLGVSPVADRLMEPPPPTPKFAQRLAADVPAREIKGIETDFKPQNVPIREYWPSLADIEQKIMAETPACFDVAVGEGQTITLHRSLIQGTNGMKGICLTYAPQGAPPEAPRASATFWSTELELNVAEKFNRLKDQAASLYQIRKKPIATHAPAKPISLSPTEAHRHESV